MMIRGVTKREDGFVFNGKYKKTKKYGLRPEFSSPEAFKKLKERCRKYKSIRSNYFKIKYYKIVNRFKLKTGCSFCSYKKCSEALQFHHIDKNTKLFGISDKLSKKHNLSYKKWKEIKNEIKKCIVLCANCHAEETYRERSKV
jgi:hypothetical protein|tara:strand:- start:219 stop:647 length:429 start_codon:yes stop_codon:yes gene_type:complete